ncbi:MAG TPA: bifunctional diaminohydroxyphosphoribosylaminopyrimidine deaminase/5-amino-6-(5-phosphoribosylamino)uracil reductase RibD [Bacteroidota bacterium]|nr:bifunctional diaminohydroxyphosphoribosylaminopyrimidine deaminase/5-amino-6-(5-phosphoribosylamino)uracil reductase RibD [Bacteroidota bacterium]
MTAGGSARDNDVRYMRQCLDIAAKGYGAVSPNPLVGALLVKHNRVIGQGYHRRYGGPHAEVHAVNDAERRGHSVEGATLYVSLEPCFHHGNTPPCVNLVIEKKIARVVAAVTDPNPLVHGKSIRKLRRAGIACTLGVMRREAERLNAAFFTFITRRRPFVAIKTAQTADGFIARADGSSKWITNDRARAHVHKLRARYDAVLVGAGTVIADNPQLTVRNASGRNPLRIVLDGNLRIPVDTSIVTTSAEAPTIVYTATAETRRKKSKIRALESLGVVVVELDARIDGRLAVADVLADLAAHQITSVLVEGGSDIYAEFLRARMADLLYRYASDTVFGEGIPGVDRLGIPVTRTLRKRMQFGKDWMDEYELAYPRVAAQHHGDARARTGR